MAETPSLSPAHESSPGASDRSFVIAADMLRNPARLKRDMLLAPVLPCASLTLLHGPRGVGKTFLALSIALAVASGGPALCWRAKRPARVLYVDGEMPRATMLDRLGALAAGAGCMPAAGHLRLLASEGREDERPNLATRAGREMIDGSIGDGVDLLVLDSLAVLLRGQGNDPGRAWFAVEDWLLGLRSRGIAVLVVRNGNTNRDRSETTRHADIVDVALALRRPADYDPLEGARFELTFSKGRALYGPAARPIEAALDYDGQACRWTVLDQEQALASRAMNLFAEGFSVRETAARLRISKSHAHRLRRDIGARVHENLASAVPSGTVLGQQEEFENEMFSET